ncbi:hypothetical protein HPB50_000163 [Hyalomma asiaticum]|uniref:Uncharacterized protein n=1 Tax=Hyalomma asiaticum TaxID=266040 RepID=A0ACB7T9K1_HYAAI|nr:hypothetical protein HPB50_000163 [Hyalomma asiaticum]
MMCPDRTHCPILIRVVHSATGTSRATHSFVSPLKRLVPSRVLLSKVARNKARRVVVELERSAERKHHFDQVRAGNTSSCHCFRLPTSQRDLDVSYSRPLPKKTVNSVKSDLLSNVALPAPSKDDASRRTSALHRGRSMTIRDTFRKWSPGKSAFAW